MSLFECKLSEKLKNNNNVRCFVSSADRMIHTRHKCSCGVHRNIALHINVKSKNNNKREREKETDEAEKGHAKQHRIFHYDLVFISHFSGDAKPMWLLFLSYIRSCFKSTHLSVAHSLQLCLSYRTDVYQFSLCTCVRVCVWVTFYLSPIFPYVCFYSFIYFYIKLLSPSLSP